MSSLEVRIYQESAQELLVLNGEIPKIEAEIAQLEAIREVARKIEMFINGQVLEEIYTKSGQKFTQIWESLPIEQKTPEKYQEVKEQARNQQDLKAEKVFLQKVKQIAQMSIPSSFREVQPWLDRHYSNLRQIITNLENSEAFKGKTNYKALIGQAETIFATLNGFKEGRRNELGIVGAVKSIIKELNLELEQKYNTKKEITNTLKMLFAK